MKSQSVVLKYLVIGGAVLYLLSLTGPYYYYGSLRSALYKLPTLAILLVGSVGIGLGINKLSSSRLKRSYSIPSLYASLFTFFFVKLIIDLWMSIILTDKIYTIIGWLVINDVVVFRYIIAYDVLWCLIGIAYSVVAIIESNTKIINIKTRYIKVDLRGN